MSDLEHYIRVAEAIIDMHVDASQMSIPALSGDPANLVEPEIRERIYYHAEHLGKSLSEMISWLRMAQARPAATAAKAVGNQRLGLDRSVSERPVRARLNPIRPRSDRKSKR